MRVVAEARLIPRRDSDVPELDERCAEWLGGTMDAPGITEKEDNVLATIRVVL